MGWVLATRPEGQASGILGRQYIVKPPTSGAFIALLERLTNHPFIGVHGR